MIALADFITNTPGFSVHAPPAHVNIAFKPTVLGALLAQGDYHARTSAKPMQFPSGASHFKVLGRWE
jgi:hypothetical protein